MDPNEPQRSLTLNNTNRIRTQKFRSSCDACSASKIKCDQGQPACLRCLNLGVKCNYSPSRRMGKPPAVSRDQSASTNGGRRQQTNQPKPKKRQLKSPNLESGDPPMKSTSSDPTISPLDAYLLESEDLLSMRLQPDAFYPQDWSNQSTGDIPLTSANIFDQEFDFMDLSATPHSTQLDLTNRVMFDDLDSLSVSSQAQSSGGLRASTDSFPSPLIPSQFSPQLHDCTSLASATLQSLYLDPSVCGTSVPRNYMHSTPSIDKILINNKAAIKNTYTLLSCPCSLNPHVALTLALICDKILVCYEAIIGAAPATRPASGSPCPENPFATPITVGAFRMDAEDEKRMKIQLVVNELRKVKGLVEKYAERYCAGKSDDKERNEGIYSALEEFLRSKFRGTLKTMVDMLNH
ncbi:hypothetical protein MMC12_001848 [Toensbergia leucococca]|nr:hypothetical protein [Toensbergia leucococca]